MGEDKDYLKDKIAEIEKTNRRRLHQMQKKADELGEQVITISSYRNGRSIMRFPLFSSKYSRNGRQEEGISYEDPLNGISFLVSPSAAYGMPDQVDGNVIRLVISKAREIHFSTGVCPTVVYLRIYEMLKAFALSTGGKSYQILRQRLNRIAGTQYTGNIFYKDKIFTGTLFSFSYPIDDDANGVVRINLNPEFKEYLDKDTTVLAIPTEVIKLKSPFAIRIRELVQIHIGKKSSWSIGLEKLSKLCQTESPLKEFKRTIRKVDIPYFISFSGGRRLADQVVNFVVKERQPDLIAPIIEALTS